MFFYDAFNQFISFWWSFCDFLGMILIVLIWRVQPNYQFLMTLLWFLVKVLWFARKYFNGSFKTFSINLPISQGTLTFSIQFRNFSWNVCDLLVNYLSVYFLWRVQSIYQLLMKVLWFAWKHLNFSSMTLTIKLPISLEAFVIS